MSRVGAAVRAEIPRPAPRARAKKSAPPQDRLSTRKLYFRRVKRSLKPGLWVLGAVSVLIVGGELVRSLPSIASAPAPARVAAQHNGFGLAALGADLGLRISKVEVVGAQTVDPAALRAAIGVRPGEPALGFSLGAVQARVEQLGPVQSATVERVLPGTLIVKITERNAFAIWQTGGASGAPAQFVLIDKNGKVIAGQDAAAAKRREPSLLLLTGADAPQYAAALMSELKAVPALAARVTAAERVDGLRWNLILKDQTLVKLPVEGERDAINQLGALQASMQLLDRPVEVIDLRQAGKLVVRPYPAASPASAKDSHT
jgi:cell division protein FtsQ